ncbi:MAG: type III pantothenate kinase [Gammaproteobacteria bacterium]
MGERLIVDLGSARVAWRGPGVSGVAVHTGVPGACLAEAFGSGSGPDEVIVGSVAPAVVTQNLREWCRENWGVVPRELVATAAAGGVRNAYAEPARLGIDRWAALVAAWKACGGSALIADCGTAVTVDYLAEDGRHVGGLIAPGLRLMREALAHGTRLAPTSGLAPTPPLFGTDTELGVTGGTLAAVTGLLAYAAEKTAARYGPPRALMLTGGDAPLLSERLRGGWQVRPELVLDGLEWLVEQTP